MLLSLGRTAPSQAMVAEPMDNIQDRRRPLPLQRKRSPSGAGINPFPDLLEEIELADTSGLSVFEIGEHHTAEFVDSSPAILLAAAATRTTKIRLSSGISILSVADPVRLMEDFSSLDLVSGGRAEVIAGRGAYAEAFALFGNDISQYDALVSEKVDLLLRLRSGEPVHWKWSFSAYSVGPDNLPPPRAEGAADLDGRDWLTPYVRPSR